MQLATLPPPLCGGYGSTESSNVQLSFLQTVAMARPTVAAAAAAAAAAVSSSSLPITSLKGRTVLKISDTLDYESSPRNRSFSCSLEVPTEGIGKYKTEQTESDSNNVKVKFVLQRACQFGQQFNVIGNDPLIGAWKPGAAVPMKWSEGHVWTAEMDVPVGKRIEFKFILTGVGGHIEWQPGGNRVFETSQSQTSLLVQRSWDRVEEDLTTTVCDFCTVEAIKTDSFKDSDGTSADLTVESITEVDRDFMEEKVLCVSSPNTTNNSTTTEQSSSPLLVAMSWGEINGVPIGEPPNNGCSLEAGMIESLKDSDDNAEVLAQSEITAINEGTTGASALALMEDRIHDASPQNRTLTVRSAKQSSSPLLVARSWGEINGVPIGEPPNRNKGCSLEAGMIESLKDSDDNTEVLAQSEITAINEGTTGASALALMEDRIIDASPQNRTFKVRSAKTSDNSGTGRNDADVSTTKTPLRGGKMSSFESFVRSLLGF